MQVVTDEPTRDTAPTVTLTLLDSAEQGALTKVISGELECSGVMAEGAKREGSPVDEAYGLRWAGVMEGVLGQIDGGRVEVEVGLPSAMVLDGLWTHGLNSIEYADDPREQFDKATAARFASEAFAVYARLCDALKPHADAETRAQAERERMRSGASLTTAERTN